jgi:hypothetical protein
MNEVTTEMGDAPTENLKRIQQRIIESSKYTFTRDAIHIPYMNTNDKQIIQMAMDFIQTFIGLRFHRNQLRMRTTVFTDQMFGSGKSRLGDEFINQVVALKDHILKFINDVYKESQKNEFSHHILDYMTQATCKRIELGGLLLILDQFPSEFTSTESTSYFLHIDEASGKESEIRKVWIQICRLQEHLYSHNGTFLFVYFSGKMTLMNMIGRGTEDSPTSVSWLFLNPLKKEHLTSILQQLSNKQFKISNEEYFIQKLYECTGGVPRLVEYVLLVLTKTQACLETNDEIDYAMDVLIFRAIQKYAPDAVKFSINNPILENIAVQFLLSAQLGIAFDIEGTLEAYNFNNKPEIRKVGDWIVQLPFYVGNTDNGLIRIVGGSYILKLLEEHLEEWYIMRYISHIDHGSALTSTTDLFLKVVLSQRLHYIFSNLRQYPDFLKETLFITNQQPTISRLITFPKVTQCVKRYSITLDVINNIEQLNVIDSCQLKEFLVNLPDGTMATLRGESNSADLYIKIRALLGIQVKSGNESIGFKKLQIEFNKSQLPLNSIFVMAAMSYSNEVSSLIDSSKNGWIVLDSGIYYRCAKCILHMKQIAGPRRQLVNLLSTIWFNGVKIMPVRRKKKDGSHVEVFASYYALESSEFKNSELKSIGQQISDAYRNHNIKQKFIVDQEQIQVVLLSKDYILKLIGKENTNDFEAMKTCQETSKILSILAKKRKREYDDSNPHQTKQPRLEKTVFVDDGNKKKRISATNFFDLTSNIKHRFDIDYQFLMRDEKGCSLDDNGDFNELPDDMNVYIVKSSSA